MLIKFDNRSINNEKKKKFNQLCFNIYLNTKVQVYFFLKKRKKKKKKKINKFKSPSIIQRYCFLNIKPGDVVV